MTADAGGAQAKRPYAPSWVNSFNAWLERLPGPVWVAYLGLAGLAILVNLGGLALVPSSGEFPLGGIMYYGTLPVAMLALIHSLDRTAIGAVHTLRPNLDMSDAEASDVLHQLTVVPARPAAVIAVLSFASTPLTYVSDPIGSGIVGYSPIALVFRGAWEGLITAILVILVYHTLRQLRLIARLHRRVHRIDVFDQARLYAMSGVTSRTAIGLVILLAPSILLIPEAAGVPFLIVSVAFYALSGVIAVLAFVVPMWGMHQRLVTEKERLQVEAEARLKGLLGDLNGDVDRRDLTRADAMNKTLMSMVQQRDILARIPTWPWSAGTLTGFASALALPIVLFLIQRALSQVL